MTREQDSFELISKAGSAFSILVDVLNDCRNGQFAEVETKIANAEEMMNNAHNIQTRLITEQINGQEEPPDLLMVHAQDTLMNTILMFTITKEFVHMYQDRERSKVNG